MAMAGRNAARATFRERVVGSEDRFANQTNGARAALPLSGASGCAAWIYQENPHHTARGFGLGANASTGIARMSKKHLGSSIDDFLKQEGTFEEAQAEAVKEVIAWQLTEAMKAKKISKARLAVLLKTSRTQVDRLLSAKSDITLSSLQRAAAILGRRVTIELV